MEFVIVTGLSGAGKSRAVDALEMQLPQDFWPVPDYSALLYDL